MINLFWQRSFFSNVINGFKLSKSLILIKKAQFIKFASIKSNLTIKKLEFVGKKDCIALILHFSNKIFEFYIVIFGNSN